MLCLMPNVACDYGLSILDSPFGFLLIIMFIFTECQEEDSHKLIATTRRTSVTLIILNTKVISLATQEPEQNPI